MADATDRKLVFKSALEIPYDVRFIPLVQTFSDELVTMGGGDQGESGSISSALDEVLCFIIDAYPDEDMAEFIHIDFELFDDNVATASIRNMGPPIHPNRIPRYDPKAPQSDIDGLWFFLARNYVDDLQFVNRGMEGWLVVITKRLASVSFEAVSRTPSSSGARVRDFSFRLARPEDASELIDLAYDTYRYTYTDPEFYDEDQLKRALASDQMVSMVLTTGDAIVGQISINRSAEEPSCAYVGGLMIGTAHRRTRAAFIMTEKLQEFAEHNELGLDLYWGCAVTAHTLSQKLFARIGAHPLALLLMVGPSVTYKGLAVDVQERESYVYFHLLTGKNRLETLYLPARHHEVMSPLLAQVGCDAVLSDATGEPDGGETSFIVHEFRNDRLAHLRAQTLGPEWPKELRQKMFSLRNNGMDTLVVHIPAWQPLPPGIDEIFKNLNAVFCGVSAISVREYYLVYCAPVGMVGFDSIRLADPLVDRLKEHIRSLYDEMLGG